MASLNKCCFIGNLGKAPEIRYTQSGDKIASFSIACTENWKNKAGEKESKTEWVNIVIFNKGIADVADKYLEKGSKVYIEGKLQTRKWQDQNGTDRYSTEVVIQNFDGCLIMLSGSSNPKAKDDGYQEQDGYDAYADLNDTVPF